MFAQCVEECRARIEFELPGFAVDTKGDARGRRLATGPRRVGFDDFRSQDACRRCGCRAPSEKPAPRNREIFRCCHGESLIIIGPRNRPVARTYSRLNADWGTALPRQHGRASWGE